MIKYTTTHQRFTQEGETATTLGTATALSSDSDAAEDAAVIYSQMGCCKAADVDFRKWLLHVLSHLHEYDQDLSLDLADFLPDNLKEAGVL